MRERRCILHLPALISKQGLVHCCPRLHCIASGLRGCGPGKRKKGTPRDQASEALGEARELDLSANQLNLERNKSTGGLPTQLAKRKNSGHLKVSIEDQSGPE